MIDQARLKEVVRSNIETLCRHFFPLSRKDGIEWKIADISGEKGDSLGIRLTPENAGVWIDRATGQGGDFVQLLMRSRNLTFPDAAAEIGQFLGVDLQKHQQPNEYIKNGAYVPVDWIKCHKLTADEEKQLANWRGYSADFVHRIAEGDLIRVYGTNSDARWVFPIHLGGKVAGTHSRPFDWTGPGSCPWSVFPTKSQNGPGIQPLIIGEPKGATTAHVLESPWDALTLDDKLKLDLTDGFVALCTRGASNGKLASELPDSIQEVCLWPQNDEPGQKWAEDTKAYLPKRAAIKIVKTPAEYPDVNDWTRAGATADDLFHAIESAQSEKFLKGASLLEYSRREINHGLTLLGNRWLCVGGGAMIVGPSGIGKSTFSIQGAALWACGRAEFGIKPARPLRILIIQAEDDEGDSIEMARVLTHLQLDQNSLELVGQNTHLEFINDKTGTGFAKYLNEALEQKKRDLVIINPFSAYLGGDVKKAEITTPFLRNWINPILTAHQVGIIFIHHTPKTNYRDTSDWKFNDWMYAGAGAADITNWARAYLAIEPEKIPGVFKFIAAKRGARIGWNRFETYWAHTPEEGKLLWVPADKDQITAVKKNATREPNDLLKLIPPLDPISQEKLLHLASEIGFGEKKVRQFLQILVENKKTYRYKLPRDGAKSAIGYSQTPPSQES
jgi:hypothetical protein